MTAGNGLVFLSTLDSRVVILCSINQSFLAESSFNLTVSELSAFSIFYKRCYYPQIVGALMNPDTQHAKSTRVLLVYKSNGGKAPVSRLPNAALHFPLNAQKIIEVWESYLSIFPELYETANCFLPFGELHELFIICLSVSCR